MWRPVSAPPACTTRAREWPPSRPSPSSKRTPSRAQLGDPGGSLVRQELDRARPAEAAPRGERVGGMQSRVVVRADRGGDAALRRIAVRARVRRLREHEHRGAGVGGSERGGEAGDPGSDDEDVACLAFLPHKR